MPRDARAGILAAARAGADRFEPRGLEYLYVLIVRLARKGPVAGGAPRHLAPAELCRAFREAASADFGRLASHVVERWGLASGGQVGGAVRLLAEQGCLKSEADEAWEDYDAAGLFRFP
jgi:uncharacterized repeat protein (TIGR04138 family)